MTPAYPMTSKRIQARIELLMSLAGTLNHLVEP